MTKNQMNFTYVGNAIIQAIALSMFYKNGRHVVYRVDVNNFKVMYDDCKVRDDVDEDDIIFEAHSTCDSGTYDSYRECLNIAREKCVKYVDTINEQLKHGLL